MQAILSAFFNKYVMEIKLFSKKGLLITIGIFFSVFFEVYYLMIADENSDFQNSFFDFFSFIVFPIGILVTIFYPILGEIFSYIFSIFLLSIFYAWISIIIINFFNKTSEDKRK